MSFGKSIIRFRFAAAPRDRASLGLSLAFLAVSLALWGPGSVCFLGYAGVTFGAALALAVLGVWLAGAFYFGGAIWQAAGAEHPGLRWIWSLGGWLAWPFGGVLLAPLLFRLGRRRHAAIALASTLLYIGVIAARLRLLPFVSDWAVELGVWLTLLGLYTAISGLPHQPHEGQGIRFLAVAVLIYSAFILAAGIVFQHSNARFAESILHRQGRSGDWRQNPALSAPGLPIDREPLATLIADCPGRMARLEPGLGRDDCRREVERIHAEHPEFVAALEKLLAAPPERICHTIDEKTGFWGIRLPELGAFRCAAYFIGMEMAIDCGDSDKVLRYNRELVILRDLVAKDVGTISGVVASALEHIRLNALLRPLAAGTLTKSDCDGLLKPSPDWGRVFAKLLCDEISSIQYGAASYNRLVLFFSMDAPDNLWWSKLTELNFYPPELVIFQQLDYRMVLMEMDKNIAMLSAPFGEDSRRAVQVDSAYGMLPLCLFMPSFKSVHWLRACLEYDMPQGFGVLAAALRRRAETGGIPEDLGFLPAVPLDKIYQEPFIYETGNLKYRDFNAEDAEFHGVRLLHRKLGGRIDPHAPGLLAVPLDEE
ncbi:MAG: hypothetical protein PHI35_01365 [Victivallaceae bacterium]|nr:hypothetical protein [Victivallaceae bacterium]